MSIELQLKIIYLQRLIGIWVKYFSKAYTHSDVLAGKKYLYVKMWSLNENGHKHDFDDAEFPIKSLGRITASYKGKVNRAFKNRHKKS